VWLSYYLPPEKSDGRNNKVCLPAIAGEEKTLVLGSAKNF